MKPPRSRWRWQLSCSQAQLSSAKRNAAKAVFRIPRKSYFPGILHFDLKKT
ncbi:hypothetical protein CLOSTMETH_03341 [[Clostridium] methylpentosum DSM 5476]|uniref:Uncharacterized protein n=1 Tax=[Clostridium] methylpentosum DSM 5476 TaxID=537013 RepID=C0EHJ6_9FIRM|nr:hypothetical protein CLOSTMETH_03341 [[Clostridium] methylpentosum DSM 5476]